MTTTAGDDSRSDCPNQVLIFGSFSEDESRLFQGKSTRNELPPENAILQFGSLDFNSLRPSEGFCAETKQITTSKRSKDTEASKMVAKDSTFKDAKAAITTDLQNSVEGELSGNTNGCLPLNDGVFKKENDTFGLDLMHISKPGTLPEILITTTVHDNEVERSNGINIFVDASSPIGGNQKTSSEQIPLFKSLVPRGLTNLGNLCFLNATLQALLSCSLFVQLLRDIRTRDISKTRHPTLHAFVEFISDFDITHDFSSKKNEKGILEIGKPFSPIMFDVVLKKFTPDVPSSLSGRPRQEDAQEFLSFIMDQMHDELLKLGGHLSSSNGESLPLILSAEDDGWETVGPKNKSAVTRTQSFMPSELSAIFGGQLRSVVKARGNKASATVQPFLLLHLDIFPEAVHSIEDAFRLFSTPETVEGYRAAAGKAGIVNASKSVKIQTLSKVMILHLMRFSYGSKGSRKLHKPVRFPLELVLGRELLVTPSSKGHKYELVATITHHGWEPSKGHYTADARDSDGRWLRYDDSTVKAVGENAVLHDLAYLLFYKQV